MQETQTESEKLREAYEMGYAQTEHFRPDLEIPGWDEMSEDQRVTEAFESFDGHSQYAGYANHTLPSLRAMAGFEDSGYGTYTECPSDAAMYFFTDLVDAYQNGYIDGFLGDEKADEVI